MIDRPDPADPHWLAAIEEAFGDYDLAPMTQGGERGIVCQMRITADSVQHLRTMTHPLERSMRSALVPLVRHPPAVTLSLSWSLAHRCWVSQIVAPDAPLFPLGLIVGTPGAVRALEQAEQSPFEFLDRHIRGDWGALGEEDQQENVFSVQHGFRILSAYTTSAGEPLWVITEADRSATILLLPSEY
jgi:hypothetical protein